MERENERGGRGRNDSIFLYVLCHFFRYNFVYKSLYKGQKIVLAFACVLYLRLGIDSYGRLLKFEFPLVILKLNLSTLCLFKLGRINSKTEEM